MTKDQKNQKPCDIAIIGIGCLFPQADNVNQFWQLIYNGQDAITEVPQTHWAAKDYFDKDPSRPDHTYCTRGGFLSPITFDPTEFGIPPANLEATDTSQLLGLVAAKQALDDAGYGEDKDFDRENVSVIIGVTGTQELVIPLGARLGHPIWRNALLESGIDSEKTETIVNKISDSYVGWQENSFPGLLGNVVAGRIASRFNFGGTNCVVDAACASSLSALHLAVMELESGRSSMAVTGGVDTFNDIFMYMCFSKTPALSPTGNSRPFSADADGTVLGEGLGVVILKRLEDALQDGDRIYSVIKSIGSSSDGRSKSIYSPRKEGQIKALERAYAHAKVDPETIELIEGHGTGTKVGDAVELSSLAEIFKPHPSLSKWCALGSIKSQIGHTKAAAGIAGVIKASLALYHQTIPPTIKVNNPQPVLTEDSSPFYLSTKALPWLPSPTHPRRAGVSSFGFGGSNYHVLMEENSPNPDTVCWHKQVELITLSGKSTDNILKQLTAFSEHLGHNVSLLSQLAFESRKAFCSTHTCRLALVLDGTADYQKVFQNAKQALQNNQDATLSLNTIFFSQKNPDNKIAFLFPGQGSQYTYMGADLFGMFPGGITPDDSLTAQFIFPRISAKNEQTQMDQKALTRTDRAQPAIGLVSLNMIKTLNYFGVKPDSVAGHSYGEITALHAANCIDQSSFKFLSRQRGELMNNIAGDSGTMLAVKAPLADIEKMIDQEQLNVVLANRNTPKQGILSGHQTEIDKAVAACNKHGLSCRELVVSAAFHSPIMEEPKNSFAKLIQEIEFKPPQIPVYAGSSGNKYPNDPTEIKKILSEQLTSPVNYVDMINQLYNDGLKTFIEVGPGTVLTGLTKNTLNSEDITCIPLDKSKEKSSGIIDLAKTLANLAVIGYPVELHKWLPFSSDKKKLMQVPLTGANYRGKSAKKTTTISESHALDTPTTNVASSNSGTNLGYLEKGNVMSSSNPHDQQQQHSVLNQNGRPPVPADSAPVQRYDPNLISESFKVVQEGIRSIQSLQQQTTNTHMRFLEGQERANQSLQEMMIETQRMVNSLSGIPAPTSPYAHHRNRPRDPLQIQSYDTPNTHPMSNIQQIQNQTITAPFSNLGSGYQTTQDGYQAPHSDHQTTGFQHNHELQTPTIQPIQTIQPVEIITHAAPPVIRTIQTSPAAFVSNSVTDSSDVQVRAEKTGSEFATGVDPELIKQNMLTIVCDLTGYPEEMLDLDMDIEADLGIDSIKRVEILSRLNEKIPHLKQVAPEDMGTLRTLGEIVDYLTVTPETAQPVGTISDAGQVEKKKLSVGL